ncbi:hypothetical protein [Rhizorhabdus argentea]|uniref:hypothetical protein n=1 Tax=Rhizorhabdus argentea TaxID=1387174 RepID=UPI0030EBDAE3
MDIEERAELVRRLFSLMTAKLEDAASEAVDGQGTTQSHHDQIVRADRVERKRGREAALHADAFIG